MGELGTSSVCNFKFYTGIPCLDFLVTLRGRREERLETLQSFAALVSWCRMAGIAGAHDTQSLVRVSGADGRAYVRTAIALREALYRIFSAATSGQPVPLEAVTSLNRVLRRGPAYCRVDLGNDGQLTKRMVATAGPWHLLLAIAQSAVDLLTGRDAALIHACANPRCSVIFVDRSKNRSRRWCSMSLCGNLMKVTRFHQRVRAKLAR